MQNRPKLERLARPAVAKHEVKMTKFFQFPKNRVCCVIETKMFVTMNSCPPKSSLKLEVMNDQQSERDHRQLRIDKVGVRGLRFPIQIRDKERTSQSTIATIGMFVDLPQEFKGTHMSRFIEVLNSHGHVVHVESITDILYAMQAKLKSAVAHLEMEFPFFLVKKAPVSGMESVMDYTARFDATDPWARRLILY